ncbi:MAG: hypothetical protein JW829_02995, partial [Pirellulales bacterium]|nr:hypothetical protein [Pirellulales bacterium]
MRQPFVESALLALGGFAVWGGMAHGEPLWKQLAARPRVDANAASDYSLTESNGPWLIMAATFSGDGAESQARSLVQEFRSEHNLAAYVYRMTFDLASDAPMRGVDRYGQLQRAKYQRGDTVTEYAVLVGDFPSVEDADAQ